MFVLKSKYKAALAEAEFRLKLAHISRRSSLELVERLTRENYLLAQKAGSNVATQQFTREEIETLIRLCHPDKHGGSARANDMTVRLLAMRKEA